MSTRYIPASRSRVEWVRLIETAPEFGPTIRGHQYYDTPFEVWWRLGMPEAGSLVVDVGCGHGRMAVPLVDLPGVQYFGLDVIPAMVGWCQRVFLPWTDHILFYNLGVRNSRYSPDAPFPADWVEFPCIDASADVVLALSLFTHLETPAAVGAYLYEITRVLKPGGKLLASFFFAPPNEPNANAERTVYREGNILPLLATLGLRVEWRGGGLTTEWDDQTDLLLVKE